MQTDWICCAASGFGNNDCVASMTSSDHKSSNESIVLFDGHCNLCNSSVQFILKKERNSRLLFASLQSEAGQKILSAFNYPSTYLDSVLLIENSILYSESGAALRITKYLKAPWSWLQIFWIIPAFLRNGLYRFIAKRRLHWFGQSQSCWVMTPEWKTRFIQ